MSLPVSVWSPGASRVVGIARVGWLCIHGDAVPPIAWPLEGRRPDGEGRLVERGAIDGPAQEPGGVWEPSAVRLESNPAGARWGRINLQGEKSQTWTRQEREACLWHLSRRDVLDWLKTKIGIQITRRFLSFTQPCLRGPCCIAISASHS